MWLLATANAELVVVNTGSVQGCRVVVRHNAAQGKGREGKASE